MKRNEMQEGFVMTTAAEAVTPAGAGVLVRGRTSVSVIRSSRCQCTGQVGVRGGCAQSLELVMILAVWSIAGDLLAGGHGVGTVAITQSERTLGCCASRVRYRSIPADSVRLADALFASAASPRSSRSGCLALPVVVS